MNVFVYKWTRKYRDVADKRNGRCVLSPIFHTLANDTYMFWNIEFYPNGRKPLCQDKCSIFLHLAGTNTKYDRISAKFQFELARSRDRSFQTPFSDQHDFILNKISDTSLCFHRFAPSFSKLAQKDLLLLGEDRILIKCTIELATHAFKQLVTESLMPAVIARMSFSDMAFETLVSQPHDVIFVVNGGKQFHSHKKIVAKKCAALKYMFDVDDTTFRYLELEEDTIVSTYTLADVDPNVMTEILRFIYTDSISVEKLKRIAAQVLPIAERYGLLLLRNKCADLMGETLTRENAIEYLISADQMSENEPSPWSSKNLKKSLKNPDGNHFYARIHF